MNGSEALNTTQTTMPMIDADLESSSRSLVLQALLAKHAAKRRASEPLWSLPIGKNVRAAPVLALPASPQERE